jgi:hypothetical protein
MQSEGQRIETSRLAPQQREQIEAPARAGQLLLPLTFPQNQH